MKWLLWPASLIWNGAARLRAAAYRRGLFRARRLQGTVISVGNLTAGGTGKTPMVLWLAERLLSEGKRVGILTRGYRAGPQGTGGVPQSDEVAIYRERLKHRVELGVGADRFATGKVLAAHGVDHFLLDDGFQHLKLARDADIVLLDATNPFGGGHMLPTGLLREPSSALRRASVVVITRSDHAPAVEAGVRRYTDAPIYYAVPELVDVLPIAAKSAGVIEGFNLEQKAFAFCGIGNPNAFFEDLGRWGVHVVGRSSFSDHHVYAQAELNALETKARGAGASVLICTEKDFFNLRNAGESSLPIYFARITLRVSEPDKFWEAIRQGIRKRQGQDDLH